jgi:folate-binding protein YgfZ
VSAGARARALASAARAAAGLFALPQRGVLEVEGEDRVRWLDGMLTNEVARLAPGPGRSGCRALALTRKGGVLADVHIWLRPRCFWLETEAAAVPGLLAHLRKLVVADDVQLADRSSALAILALEGPAAPDLLERAAGRPLELAEGSVAELEIGGVALAAAAYGASGEPAFRLAAPARAASRAVAALQEAGRPLGLVEGTEEAFEILRIEAGTPRFGAELDPGVLPAEARLEAAIAFEKGCYTGQEVVARVESRGRVRRHLVGLRVEGDAAPEPGAAVEAQGARVGEVTSGCVSPSCGPIALAYVSVPHDAPGTSLRVGGRVCRVAPLPFVVPRAARPSVGEKPRRDAEQRASLGPASAAGGRGSAA